MNLVTTGPGDTNAKEKKSINQIMNKNNTTYRYILVLLNTSFRNKDPLIRNVFEKHYKLSMNLYYCMTLKILSIPVTDSFSYKSLPVKKKFGDITTITKVH